MILILRSGHCQFVYSLLVKHVFWVNCYRLCKLFYLLFVHRMLREHSKRLRNTTTLSIQHLKSFDLALLLIYLVFEGLLRIGVLLIPLLILLRQSKVHFLVKLCGKVWHKLSNCFDLSHPCLSFFLNIFSLKREQLLNPLDWLVGSFLIFFSNIENLVTNTDKTIVLFLLDSFSCVLRYGRNGVD